MGKGRCCIGANVKDVGSSSLTPNEPGDQCSIKVRVLGSRMLLIALQERYTLSYLFEILIPAFNNLKQCFSNCELQPFFGMDRGP